MMNSVTLDLHTFLTPVVIMIVFILVCSVLACKVSLGVEKVAHGQSADKEWVELMVDCQGCGGGCVLIITTRNGNCAKVVLSVKVWRQGGAWGARRTG